MGAFSPDHMEELPEKVWIAALVQMFSGDLRDVVCQTLNGHLSYTGVRDKFRDLVPNRVSLEDARPAPNDIGALQGEYDERDMEEYL